MADHVADYFKAALAIHAAAAIIVNITPTPKDNEALGRFGRVVANGYRVIEMLAGIVSPLAKR